MKKAEIKVIKKEEPEVNRLAFESSFWSLAFIGNDEETIEHVKEYIVKKNGYRCNEPLMEKLYLVDGAKINQMYGLKNILDDDLQLTVVTNILTSDYMSDIYFGEIDAFWFNEMVQERM